MKLRIFIFAAAILATAGAVTFAVHEYGQIEETQQWQGRLEQIRTAAQAVDVQGSLHVTTFDDERTAEMDLEVRHVHPDSTSVEVKRQPFHGRHHGGWHGHGRGGGWDSRFKSRSNWFAPVLDSRLAAQNYKVSELPAEQVAGRDTTPVELHPRRCEGPWFKLWVDHGTSMAMAVETHDPSGRCVSRSAFESIKFETPAMPPAPPKNPTLSLEDLKSNPPFQVWIPTYLPSGYQFLRAERRMDFVQLHFTDGMAVLAVTERKPQGPPRRDTEGVADHRVVHGMQMLKITLGSTEVTVMGWSNLDELSAVITSMNSFGGPQK